MITVTNPQLDIIQPQSLDDLTRTLAQFRYDLDTVDLYIQCREYRFGVL